MINESIKILVIDDNEETRLLMNFLLATERSTVCASLADVESSLDLLTKHKPDIIVANAHHRASEFRKSCQSIALRYPTPILLLSDGESNSADTVDLDCVVSTLDCGTSASSIESNRSLIIDSIFDLDESHEIKNSFMRKRLQLLINHREELNKAKSDKKKDFSAENYFDLVSGRRKPQALDVQIVAIAISTGGPPALNEIITKLPESIPVPIVIVQHIPAEFSLSLAKRLEASSRIKVKQAEDGEHLHAGMVYVAPGGFNLSISKRHTIELTEDDRHELYKPSANVLFNTIAEVYGKKSLAIIMTGMGNDGTNGGIAIHNAGGYIAVQSPETCIVSGMVQSALKNKIVDIVLNDNEIAGFIASVFGQKIEAKQATVS